MGREDRAAIRVPVSLPMKGRETGRVSRNPIRKSASVRPGSPAQAQNSSAQAAWNCGPRRLSASSAEKAYA